MNRPKANPFRRKFIAFLKKFNLPHPLESVSRIPTEKVAISSIEQKRAARGTKRMRLNHYSHPHVGAKQKARALLAKSL